ncbi:DUF2877 domain-containing protein [Candidatus Bipolaricaulota bacterium]|nr:DUF2877 domain-containing protein [Candidatus Bipolaricaulota bacterium]
MSIGCSIYFKQEGEKLGRSFPLPDNRHTDYISTSVPGVVSHRRTLHAARIGGHASRFLTAQPTAGPVVSAFRCGINALFVDGDQSAIISIQTAAVAFHPWAVEVDGEDEIQASGNCRPFPFPKPDDAPGRDCPAGRLEAGRDAITLHAGDDEIAVDLSCAAVVPLRIVPFDARQADRARIASPQLQTLIRGSTASRLSVCEPLDRPIDFIVARWRSRGDPAILTELVGLGVGATPSGDDLLVGLLAALHAWEHQAVQARHLLHYLRGKLPSAAKENTTRMSTQTIVSACEAAFPEPLVDLVSVGISPDFVALEAAIQHVASLGHTSGVRLLQGFLLGWGEARIP